MLTGLLTVVRRRSTPDISAEFGVVVDGAGMERPSSQDTADH
jgi:hypothetical protein